MAYLSKFKLLASRDWLPVSIFSLGIVIFHFFVNSSYGYFRDELYCVACGEHLAWGYVDQPSMIALIAKITRLLFGDSLFAWRFFPAIGHGCLVYCTALFVKELGGKRFAQILAMTCVCLAPVLLSFGNMLSMNIFDVLFWLLIAYLLVLCIKYENKIHFLLFGLTIGLALNNKYSVLFFLAGLGIGILLTPQRRILLNKWFWIAGGSAFIIILPNLNWQIQHDLPFVELNKLATMSKNVIYNPLEFILEQMGNANAAAFLVLIAGLLWFLLSKSAKDIRMFGWAYLIVFLLFVKMHGKPYYMAASYPIMFAGGAVAVEKISKRKRWKWLPYASIIVITIIGMIGIPFAVPLLPVEKFIAYSKFQGRENWTSDWNQKSILPQHFADQFGWPEMTATVAKVYQKLSPEDQKKCRVFCGNYGEASALDFFGKKYQLPEAYSGHNNYWLWGPMPDSISILIILGGDVDDLKKIFEDVQEVAATYHPYAMPSENLPVFLCHNPKYTPSWNDVKHYD